MESLAGQDCLGYDPCPHHLHTWKVEEDSVQVLVSLLVGKFESWLPYYIQ